MADSKFWNNLEQVVDEGCGDVGDLCLLNLRARVEALEAAANYPAKPDSSTAPAPPADGLVQRVAQAIADDGCAVDVWHDIARTSIHVTAAWLDTRGQHGCSLWLREEADRG